MEPDDDGDDFDEASLLQWKRHIQRGAKKARVSSGQRRESKKTSHLEISTLVGEVAKNNLSFTQQADPVDGASSMHCTTDVLLLMETDPSVIALSTSATVATDIHTNYKSQPPTGPLDTQCMPCSSSPPSISSSSRKANCNNRRKKFKSPSKTFPYKGQTSLLKFMNSEAYRLKTSIISRLPKNNLEELPPKRILPSENVSKGVAGSPAESSLLPATDVGSFTKVCGRKKKECWAKARGHRECPFYKRVPETGLVVDAFNYGSIPDCPAYFLTHFHADHYTQLRSRFKHPIYCSQVTANLVRVVLRVSPSFINPLPLDVPCHVEGVEVTLIDANHCPGAVMFLFKTASGKNYLHTGDFRYCVSMTHHPSLSSCAIHHLFLDTTYCKPQYTFPTQQEVIEFAVGKSHEALRRFPGTVVVSGTYKVGKEKLYLALAEALGSRICVTKEKEDVLKCLQWPALQSLLTTSPLVASVHVLPMMKLSIKELSSYLDSLQPVFSHILAFKPTGWTHSTKRPSLSSLRPRTTGHVTIYNVPYSEHSSFTEIRQFVQSLHPQKVTSTIGDVSVYTRNETMHYLEEWQKGITPQTRQTTIDEIL